MNERGQSLIETVILSLLFFVPLVWLLSTLSQIHLAALAGTSAAREAGFEAARLLQSDDRDRIIDETVDQSFLDHGLSPERVQLLVSPAQSVGRGGELEITVRYRVPLLRAPLLGELAEPSLTITATHRARIDPYRSRS